MKTLSFTCLKRESSILKSTLFKIDFYNDFRQMKKIFSSQSFFCVVLTTKVQFAIYE